MVEPFVKRRQRPAPGTIPDVLQSFHAEVRFYREIAPVVGVRVPSCLRAEEQDGATTLVLENLSGWQPGADPVHAAQALAGLHQRWQGVATERWPWLRTPTATGSDLVGMHFDAAVPAVTSRPECTSAVRALGDRLHGRIPECVRVAAMAGPATLVHGDASTRNMRTSPTGEIALLDWEDFGAAPGVSDLAWLLVSSIHPAQWDETISAYGGAAGLDKALPAAASHAFLSFGDSPPHSEEAIDWVRRIEEAARRM
jgi:Phosphotransferase enzyme family